MGFRDSFSRVSTPWLSQGLAYGIGYAVGLVLDALADATREGIKARFPGTGTPEALAFVGEAFAIDRGPTESNASYAERLRKGIDTWRTAGNAPGLLRQLRAYFLPSPPAIRLVTNRGSTWFEIDPTSGVVTKTKLNVANWIWDAYGGTVAGARWWRFWVIIDGTGRWEKWQWGEVGARYGGTRTWGSNMTAQEAQSIRRIVAKWKRAGSVCVNVIVTFDPSLFEVSDPPGAPMPSGDYDVWANRSGDAVYLQGVI